MIDPNAIARLLQNAKRALDDPRITPNAEDEARACIALADHYTHPQPDPETLITHAITIGAGIAMLYDESPRAVEAWADHAVKLARAIHDAAHKSLERMS